MDFSVRNAGAPHASLPPMNSLKPEGVSSAAPMPSPVIRDATTRPATQKMLDQNQAQSQSPLTSSSPPVNSAASENKSFDLVNKVLDGLEKSLELASRAVNILGNFFGNIAQAGLKVFGVGG